MVSGLTFVKAQKTYLVKKVNLQFFEDKLMANRRSGNMGKTCRRERSF